MSHRYRHIEDLLNEDSEEPTFQKIRRMRPKDDGTTERQQNHSKDRKRPRFRDFITQDDRQ